MDHEAFDRLARRLAEEMPRRRVLRGLGVGLLGAFGLARAGAGASGHRVEICHHTGTGDVMRIQVAASAVGGHQQHGDEFAARFGTPCTAATLPGGGFACVPVGGLSACGADCVGAGGAGDGQCTPTFVGCVPDGQVCSEFTACCSDVCGSPSGTLLTRCGACIGMNAGPCVTDDDCCGGLTCGTGDFGGICR